MKIAAVNLSRPQDWRMVNTRTGEEKQVNLATRRWKTTLVRERNFWQFWKVRHEAEIAKYQAKANMGNEQHLMNEIKKLRKQVDELKNAKVGDIDY